MILLCLLMNVCFGVGRSRADSLLHMVHPDNAVGKQCGQESAQLLFCALESDGVGEAVGGVWAGKSDYLVPPTFITGSLVSASNQITTESSTKTWLKARLLCFTRYLFHLDSLLPPAPVSLYSALMFMYILVGLTVTKVLYLSLYLFLLRLHTKIYRP